MPTDCFVAPSLLCDLVCFSAVLVGDGDHQALHPEACLLFQSRLDPSLINRLTPYFNPPQHLLSAELYVLSFVEQNLGDTSLSSPPGLPAPGPFLELLFNDREDVWNQYKAVYSDVTILLQSLVATGFVEYWSSRLLPKIQFQSNQLAEFANSYDLTTYLATMLGKPNNANPILVYLSQFAAPHGFRLFGNALVADVNSPLTDLISIVLHELLHPPCSNKTLTELTRILSQDDFFFSAYENQAPAYAYRSLEDFVEETLVIAGQMFIMSELGISMDYSYYFRNHNEGKMVFSPILFDHLRRTKMERLRLDQAVLNLVDSGTIQPGSIRKLYLNSLRRIESPIAFTKGI